MKGKSLKAHIARTSKAFNRNTEILASHTALSIPLKGGIHFVVIGSIYIGHIEEIAAMDRFMRGGALTGGGAQAAQGGVSLSQEPVEESGFVRSEP